MPLSLLGNGKFGLIAQSVKVFELHWHTGIFCQCVGMLVEVIPVQSGEWTGVVAGRFRWFELAVFAMVAHAVNVFAAGNVGLACHEACVCKLAHTQRIGELYPFHCVNINTQIPLVNKLRLDA